MHKESPTLQGGAGNLLSHNNKTTSKSRRKQAHFHRNFLPAPHYVLGYLNIKTGKINYAGYWTLRCPFHAGGREKNPSLSLHSRDGHYLCHACGAKGGDILAFYMAVTGMKFIDAAKMLGAWRRGDEL